MTPEAEVERLLPCIKPCREKSDWPIEAHYIDCLAFYRPAVADALRERDERIAALEARLAARFDEWG